jgi:hypothetical protein
MRGNPSQHRSKEKGGKKDSRFDLNRYTSFRAKFSDERQKSAHPDKKKKRKETK